MDDFEQPNKNNKRRIVRRNHIARDLRDTKGPYSPKLISDKKKDEYKRKQHTDWTILQDEE